MVTEAKLDAVKQGYESSLRQLQALLDAQARLRAVVEESEGATREALETVAEALCPEVVDRLRKSSPLGLAQVEPQDVAAAIVRDVQARLSRLGVAEASGRNLEESCEEATAENTRLRDEVTRLEDHLVQMRQEHEQATLRISILQRSLADAQRRLGVAAGSPAASSAAQSSVEDTLDPMPVAVLSVGQNPSTPTRSRTGSI